MTEAQEMFRRAGNMRLALETSEDLTGMESRAGDIFGALTQYAKLASISKGTGNIIDYGILIQNIGNEYAALNKLAAANAYFQIAEKAFSTIHFRSGESMARGKMCDVELRSQELKDPSQSRLVNALNDCAVSVAIAEAIQDPLRIAVAKYQLGNVYRRMAMVDRRLKMSTRAYGETVRALEFFKTASNISHSVGDKHWEAQERISLGEVLEDLGKRQDARGEFEKAELISKDGGDSAGTLEAQYSIARWYAEGGEFAAAKATLNPALEQIEITRRAVSDSTLQASYFAAERKCYDLAIYLEMQEFQRDYSSGADAEALQKSEAGRARSLLDALSADSSAGGQPGATTHANLLQARMEVDRAFDQRLRLMLMGGGKGELETNASELTQGLAALERIENEEYGPANSREKSAQFMTAKEIETASVNSGETYLEYALGENSSYLWIIDQGRLTSYTLPPRDEIEDMAKKWRSLVISSEGQANSSSSRDRAQLDRGRDLQQLSVKLSCALIGNAVGPQMKRLVIVPDGDLAMLPFTVMQVNACSSMPGPPLITEHDIIQTPSLSVFLSHKAPKSNNHYKGEVAVVADPVFDQDDQRFRLAQESGSSRVLGSPQSIKADASLPRLLNTKFEAESIQIALGSDQVHLFLGFDANLNTVLSPEMQNYRIWHLATHGVYDEARPEFSGLVFSLVASNRKPVYGLLKAQDIAHMQLRPELVVLSACNSAAGETLSGEGIMGLSYSFLRAGVKQVISTLWNIDDTISKDLMAGFYQEMMHNGNDAAEALRTSQLAVLHRHHNSAPYFWAGFELTSVGN
jgi:CHAT domain-containing protein